jgi:hypothetical protein
MKSREIVKGDYVKIIKIEFYLHKPLLNKIVKVVYANPNDDWIQVKVDPIFRNDNFILSIGKSCVKLESHKQ